MDAILIDQDADRRRECVEGFRKSILERLVYSIGKDKNAATQRDWYEAVVLAVRDRLVDGWIDTTRSLYRQDAKRVYYLSLEFLIGRLLESNLINLGLYDACNEALQEIGLSLDYALEAESDAALGNGGLGRLAACYLDSMASLGLAGYGYGIRYQFGLFEQRFKNGWQIEQPEEWLRFGNAWEFPRPEVLYPIQFGGHVAEYPRADGSLHFHWVSGERVLAMAHDTPVVGYGRAGINTLRLWSARATHDIDLDLFNQGDYLKSFEAKVLSENLSRVLYPNDSTEGGRELRLKQEYFFTSASLQDILRRYFQHHKDVSQLPEKISIQLNDTHPAIGIAELMRLLMDVHHIGWNQAWEVTRRVFNYTNHTLLPEALESWSVALMTRLLPRHMQIIYEINARFLEATSAARTGDVARLARLSVIDETGDRRVRMSHLAFIGSRRVNGVSALHTELMKSTVFADLHVEMPGKIINVTNGITPRRWLLQANPGLAGLITETLGSDAWITDLERLQDLLAYVDDATFCERFRKVKRQNKVRLAPFLARATDAEVPPESLFDVHIKRIHEYKRQLLNVFQTIALYNDMRTGRAPDGPPVTKVFAGKAAAGYFMAKLIIKLMNDVADVVNHDPAVAGRLKIVVVPNYNVTAAELLIPAADLSEQISTAGMEASGTGNMKFALNGAITIGTLDGANVEMREAVGAENIFIFGLTAEDATALRRRQQPYNPQARIDRSPVLAEVLAMVGGGGFSRGDRNRFQPLLQSLTVGGDPFLVLADFDDYCRAHANARALYRDQRDWTRKAIVNTARMGFFSSDRAVRAYAREIWQVNGATEPKPAAA